MKIFIVDDDPIYREMYRQFLWNMGFKKIELFADAQHCISRLADKPDIILLDHHENPICGLDALKNIKRTDPGIYAIYMSSQGSTQVFATALKYGAFDCIIKGDNKEEERVVSVIENILNIKELLAKKSASKWKNNIDNYFG